MKEFIEEHLVRDPNYNLKWVDLNAAFKRHSKKPLLATALRDELVKHGLRHVDSEVKDENGDVVKFRGYRGLRLA